MGGWEHDIIVEDSDLSIKCLDVGFRGVFVRELGAPSELPTSIAHYRSQQMQWIKGSGQLCAKKTGGAFTSSNTSPVHKVDFFFRTLPRLWYPATAIVQLYSPLAVLVSVPFFVGVGGGEPGRAGHFLSLLLADAVPGARLLARPRCTVAHRWGDGVVLGDGTPACHRVCPEHLFQRRCVARTPRRAAAADESSLSHAAHRVLGAPESTIPSLPGGIQAPPPLAAVEPARKMTAAAAAAAVADEGALGDVTLLSRPSRREDSAPLSP